MADHKTHPHDTKHGAPSVQADAEARAEGELKLKGLTPKPEAGEPIPFALIDPNDQKFLHENSPEAWQTLNEQLRKHKDEATSRKAELTLKKEEEELKLLNVKRWDVNKDKPDFICVVRGCGEEKAPGQGYHCASHSKSK